MNALLLAVGLLVATHADSARFGATPAAVGSPRFVQLVAVEGLPSDTNIREEFMNAFRGTFADERLKAERGGHSGWAPSVALPNRFRLLEGSPSDDVWTLQVVVGALAPAMQAPKRQPRPGEPKRRGDLSRRASRGMILAVTALSPEAIRNGARAMPQNIAFAFPAPPPPADASQPVTSGGYAYSWSAAGRTAALIALETLHHFSGDLNDMERCDIAPAVRIEAGR